MPTIEIREGDCLDLLRALPPDSVDAIVTDPPYGLGSPPPIADVLRAWLAGDEYRPRGRGFMGHSWDAFVPGPEVWRECLRVLKPGGHLLAFFGSRTVDVGGLAIRLAGFEIRDSLCWLYGTGFPKSLDVSKAIDKAAGAEREILGEGAATCEYIRRGEKCPGHGDAGKSQSGATIHAPATAPATPEAAAWEGWGTALKPAHEPIVMARKPLAARTVAAQVLATGTGAINVDACRIETSDNLNGGAYSGGSPPTNFFHGLGRIEGGFQQPAGRWPANVVLDEEAAEMLDAQSGYSKSPTSTGRGAGGKRGRYGPPGAQGRVSAPGDSGGASRFFYCSKASKAERGEGNAHPTVKPIELMRWLVRMITPPGGLVVDPFAGSGSTLLAARAEGFDALGFEREPSYAAIARGRLGLPDPCAAVEDVLVGEGCDSSNESEPT